MDNMELEILHEVNAAEEVPREIEEIKPKGNFTSIFGGTIVLGPQIINFLSCLTILVGMGIVLCCQTPLINESLGVGVGNLGIIVTCITIILFVWTCTTDPGVIPNNLSLQQYSITNPKSSDEVGFRRHFCHKCHSTRPPRSYHCSLCGVCVRRQDMHLLFGGTCIGQRNFTHYFLLNVFAVILAITLISINLSLYYHMTELNPGGPQAEYTFTVFNIIISTIYGSFLLLSPQTGALMLFYRMVLVSRNRTFREDFRILRGYDRGPAVLFGRHRKCSERWLDFFCPTPRARNIFKPEPVFPIGSLNDLFWLAPRRVEGANNHHNWMRSETSSNGVPYINLTDAYVTGANRHVVVREREYVSANISESMKAKLRNSQSLPLMEEGELPIFPGTRMPTSVTRNTAKSLATKIKLFKQMQVLPKSIVDFRMGHPLPSALSEGAIPRTEQTAIEENELVQLTRARQIQQIIELCLRRDRVGLVELARKINIGVLIGMADLDPDNLQLIEFHDGLPLIFSNPLQLGNFDEVVRRQMLIERNRRIRLNPQTNWIGPPQMVAAGLLQPNQHRLIRRLTGQQH